MKNKITYSRWTFSDDAVESVNVHLAVNLTAGQLEADTMTALVRTADASIMQFVRNTPIQYYHRDKPRFMGYLQSVRRDGPGYSLYATSAVGLLMERAHAGGVYSGKSARELISEICGPGIKLMFSQLFRDSVVYGWLPYAKPPQRSARDNLAQVLFAIGAVIRPDAYGTLQVVPLWASPSGATDPDRIYQDASVETEGAISSVELTEHQYSKGGEETTLFDGTYDGGVIQFSEPMYDLKTTGNLRILSSGDNYANLSSGEGTLTGRKYVHGTRQVTRQVTPGVPENIKSITDATLVSLANSAVVADRLKAYYQCRKTISSGVGLKQQNPGDIVRAYDPYDKEYVSGAVESMDLNASNILKADMSILEGFVPPSTENLGYDNVHKIMRNTLGTPYIIPPGVTTVHAVLIGAGTGGGGGTDGADGAAGTTATVNGLNVSNIGKSGEAGKGGVPGAGGEPGKVLEVDIKVPDPSKGLQIDTFCGDGSVGEGTFPASGPRPIYPKDPPGTAMLTYNTPGSSSITRLYSANGTIRTNGYTDPITGTIYALPGKAGIAGGDGGKGGGVNGINGPTEGVFLRWEPTKGENGGSAGTYSGGAGSNEIYLSEDGVYDNPYASGGVGRTKVRVGVVPGGGGGAASGGDGGSSTISNQNTGGKGADAASPSKVSQYGCGGNGGNGGGGGGGGGGGIAGVYEDPQPGQTFGRTAPGSPGGKGGKATAGTAGGDACIILTYSVPKNVQTGALVDSKGRYIVDGLGRLIIVTKFLN